MKLPVVDASDTDRHDVATGVWCGVTESSDELPVRAEVLRAACSAAGADIVAATAHDSASLQRVHDERFLEVLATAHDRWVAEGHLDAPGNPYVTAYWFPAVGGALGGAGPRRAATIRGEIGRYAMDTMTGIGPGTFAGAVAAADAALTAADLVTAGQRAAFAITRPPGHHAGRAFYGGSCYLNNAAIAAAHLRVAGATRVAIIDIDAHHGNGTQEIFWNDPGVLYASVHVDPAFGWFPHTIGHADEIDESHTNLNLPVPPGTGDADWLASIGALGASVRAFAPEAIVVSLGVDAAAEDPNSPLLVSELGFRAAGQRLADLDVPTVLVLEGGYVIESLARHTLAVLEAWA